MVLGLNRRGFFASLAGLVAGSTIVEHLPAAPAPAPVCAWCGGLGERLFKGWNPLRHMTYDYILPCSACKPHVPGDGSMFNPFAGVHKQWLAFRYSGHAFFVAPEGVFELFPLGPPLHPPGAIIQQTMTKAEFARRYPDPLPFVEPMRFKPPLRFHRDCFAFHTDEMVPCVTDENPAAARG
jgi:hypothetical protein